MLVRGFSDAIMMRTQLALAAGGVQGYLPPEHYDQIFSAHGTIMIFFVAMHFMVGLMNFAVPLQLGIRDVAFPVLQRVAPPPPRAVDRVHASRTSSIRGRPSPS